MATVDNSFATGLPGDYLRACASQCASAVEFIAAGRTKDAADTLTDFVNVHTPSDAVLAKYAQSLANSAKSVRDLILSADFELTYNIQAASSNLGQEAIDAKARADAYDRNPDAPTDKPPPELAPPLQVAETQLGANRDDAQAGAAGEGTRGNALNTILGGVQTVVDKIKSLGNGVLLLLVAAVVVILAALYFRVRG